MKKIFILMFCALLPLCATAQNTRIVKGTVISEDDDRLSGAVVRVDGRTTDTVTDEDGNFTITVSSDAKKVSVYMMGYIPQSAAIDGSVLVFRLKYDKAGSQYKSKLEKTKENRSKNYKDTYKTKGLVHSLDVSYGYQVSKGEVIYQNVGYREYGNLSPVQFTYSIGWRFNHLISLSAGVGVLANMKSLEIKGEDFASYYRDYKPKNFDLPVFINTRLYLTKTMVQPVISVSGGVYALSLVPLVDVGVGVNVRLAKAASVHLMAVLDTTPWLSFTEKKVSYKMSITPGVKLGFSF